MFVNHAQLIVPHVHSHQPTVLHVLSDTTSLGQTVSLLHHALTVKLPIPQQPVSTSVPPTSSSLIPTASHHAPTTMSLTAPDQDVFMLTQANNDNAASASSTTTDSVSPHALSEP